jgi:hypothetical protein
MFREILLDHVARTRTVLSLNVRTSVGASCDPITLHMRSRPPNGCENGQCRSQREAESLPDACMSLEPAFLPVFYRHTDISVIRADAIERDWVWVVYLITSTGHTAPWVTAWLTLPRTRPFQKLCPRAPTTSRSGARVSAMSRIALAAGPSTTSASTSSIPWARSRLAASPTRAWASPSVLSSLWL